MIAVSRASVYVVAFDSAASALVDASAAAVATAVAILFDTVDAKFASSPIAAASSFSVSSAPGAALTRLATAESVYDSASDFAESVYVWYAVVMFTSEVAIAVAYAFAIAVDSTEIAVLYAFVIDTSRASVYDSADETADETAFTSASSTPFTVTGTVNAAPADDSASFCVPSTVKPTVPVPRSAISISVSPSVIASVEMLLISPST